MNKENYIRNETNTEFAEKYSDVFSEQALLGTLLNNLKLVDIYEESLKKEDFEQRASRLIFAFINKYVSYYGYELKKEKAIALLNELIKTEPSYKAFGVGEEFYESTLCPLMNVGLEAGGSDNIFYKNVKKLKMLRSMREKGFPVENLVSEKELEFISGATIVERLKEGIRDFETEAYGESEPPLSENISEALIEHFICPEKGLLSPFPFINENFNGFTKNSLTLIGGLSNTGKSRLLVYLIIYLILKNNVKVCLISNEMTKAEFESIIITTILNMPLFKLMHGREISIEEREILNAKFSDDNGDILRKRDDEPRSEFISRALSESRLFRDAFDILICFQDYFGENLHFVNISEDYSPENLKSVVEKMKNKGCSLFAYDTLKGYKSSEWQELTQCATAFSELIKGDKEGITGIATFQLTDHSQLYSPMELSSMNIATAKHIMHVADNMIMFLRLKKEEYKNYTINDAKDLSEKQNYLAAKIIKNRKGGGKDTLYALSVDYGKNIWDEQGVFSSSGNR